MRANEYEAWYRRNDPGTSRRGQSEYDRPFKERYERPPEYSPTAEEIRRFAATQDPDEQREKIVKEWTEPASERKSRRQSKAKSRAGGAGRSIVQSVAGHVVAVVAGAAVLVGGYQAIVAESAQPEPTSVVRVAEATTWTWSEDGQTVSVGLLDGAGELIVELPADVTVTITAATCTAEGAEVYTAVAHDEDGKEYSTTRSVILAPTGHTFGEGSLVETDGGQTVIDYECTHCHEHFTLSIDVEEE